ncbi:ArsR/SmtB family transcription factor [Paenibacillus sp. GYB003]|uniref:ArsR/SmtB family transcription factor n=1 Tax=Paenibacillus sp. GYB003 TaxID=2994392 RepID=UPI002F9652F8
MVPPDSTWKDRLYEQFARIGKSLSSPKRLELLDVLAQGPKSVDALARGTGMSLANVSQHLQTLLEARLVRFTKKGTYAIYELADPSVAEFMLCLHRLGEKQLADIQTIKSELLRHYADMEPISLEALKARMEKGDVLLLDVRPREEYEAGHIPGAVSVPIEELKRHLSSLPADKEIVAYCRGPYCLMSAMAVDMLHKAGHAAFRLEEGVYEWRRFEAGGGNI